MKYDEFGRELPDPTPAEVPLQFQMTPEDLFHRRMQEMLLSHALGQQIQAAGVESMVEADDFDVEEDIDLPLSPAERAYLRAEELRVEREELEEEAKRGIRSLQQQPLDYGGDHGREENHEGNSGVGRARGAGEANSESVASPVAGNSEKAGRVSRQTGGTGSRGE